MSDANRELCLQLLYAESEEEAIHCLAEAGYWRDESAWHWFGDTENSWATIGNQQANPVDAMVEKLVNSIDAVLMRECLARGISLEGEDAPKTISDALEQFFAVKQGNLANIGPRDRARLAGQIGFIATGTRSHPNYTVFDRGEGQTPKNMPDTLLSLAKSNKLRIPFVQGKFNMGGTGVLRHAGKRRLQLVISRRCPQIQELGDATRDLWGFTIVRRQYDQGKARNSLFTYLAPQRQILSFDAEQIRMPQGSQEASLAPTLSWGTAIKIYDYNMKGRKTNIKMDLYYKMSARLPKPGLPIRFFEFRDYKQESVEQTFAGLMVRLEDDGRDNVEAGFPDRHSLRIKGEPFQIIVYAFRKDSQDRRFRQDDGVIFTLNGQAQGTFSKRFFSRKGVRMDYIRDSILVIVDASAISTGAREDLFMNSRDRLNEGELRDDLEKRLEQIVSQNALLKSLREQRRREAIAEKISDSRPLKEVLNKIIRQSRSLEALFVTGKDLSNPFRSIAAGVRKSKYKGRQHPTFFNLMKKHQGRNERPVDRKHIRFQFDTDAKNDYFGRDEFPGQYELHCNGERASDLEFNLRDGVATLNILLPSHAKEGDTLQYQVAVSDDTQIEPFLNDIEVTVGAAAGKGKAEPGKRQDPVDNNKGNRAKPDSLALPEIYEVRQEEWEKYDFDQHSALRVLSAPESGYDFYVNLDNIYLNTELKTRKPIEEPESLQSKFKFALALMGMMILKEVEREPTTPDQESLALDDIYTFTRTVAPVILPMIDSLGDLDSVSQ